MAQSKQPGYPLPAGELGEDDIVCQLVFLPDRPEYWQAFLGAYHYMTTWRAWERDEGKRGKDAAANWRAAFEMTMECWRMACLEQLQQDVSDILYELRNQNCCDPIDPTDGDQYTDDVEDGVGDVPQNIIDAGYAEDAADWDGFDDYKCMIAHVVVTSMESKFRMMAPHVDSAAMVAGGIASIAIIIAAVWTGGLSLLLAGLISSLGGVALFYDAMISGSALETLADKIATNHDALVCGFYDSDGLSDSVAGLKAVIADLFNVAEEVLMDNSGIDIDAKALYAGRYDQVDTAAVLEAAGYATGSYDCTCLGEGEHFLEHAFLTVKPAWLTGASYWYNNGNPAGSLRQNENFNAILSANQMMVQAGYTVEAGDMVKVTGWKFDYWRHASQDYKAYKNLPGANLMWTDVETPEVWREKDFGVLDIDMDPNAGHSVNTVAKWGGASYIDNWRIEYTVIKA